MKLGFVFDTKFVEFDGNFYSVNLSSKVLTDRYLNVFDELVVIGRSKKVKNNPTGKLTISNSDNIKFKCMEDASPLKRVLSFNRYSAFINEALSDCDAVICRGWRGTSICRKLGKPYLVEVVNCAWDSYWNHGFLGKLVAPIMYLLRRISTKKAPYVQYVTSQFLQKRYPTNGKSIGVSDVSLQENTGQSVLDARLNKIRNKLDGEKIIIGTAGAVDVPFKGQRFVIKAIAKLKQQGYSNFEYQIAGSGNTEKLKKLAQKLNVSDQVVFKGSIVHDEIFNWLDTLDIYIQPSLQEGLPRAMIEAMSRGLPCYGTKTGGIPELINSSCVCSSNKFISRKLSAFLLTHTTSKAMKLAIENYNKAKNYNRDVLKRKWYDFLTDFSHSVEGK